MAPDDGKPSFTSICFVAPKAHSLFISGGNIQFGGAEVQLYTLAVALASKCPHADQVQAIIVDDGQIGHKSSNGVRLVRAYALSDPLVVRAWKMGQGLLRSRASVYVQRTMTAFTPLIALLVRSAGRRFVYMLAHDREVERFPATKWFVRKLAFKTATLCVYQNERQGVELHRIRRVNAVRLSSSVPYVIPTGVPGYAERRHILWVARVAPIKQVEVLLEVASQLSHIRFVLVGSAATGQEDYRDRVFKAAAELPNVSVVPGVSLWDTKAYYESARALVNTSAGEGMPATFVQAWAGGTPVISLSVDPDRLLSDKKLGRACNDSVADLVRSIEEFWHNRDLFEAYSQRCLEHARTHHDASRNAERFLRILTNEIQRSHKDELQ